MPAQKYIAILLAAGSSSRLNAAVPKPYLDVSGKTVLEWSALKLASFPGHVGTILAVDKDSLEERIPALRASLIQAGVKAIIIGGSTRQESCALAYNAGRSETWRRNDAHDEHAFDIVLVHDAARPFFPLRECRQAIALAAEKGAAILGHFARDSLKEVDADGKIKRTVQRERIFQAATPQCFARSKFERMLAYAKEHGTLGSDDACLAEATGIEVFCVDSSSNNLKLTRPEDLLLLPCLGKTLEDLDV